MESARSRVLVVLLLVAVLAAAVFALQRCSTSTEADSATEDAGTTVSETTETAVPEEETVPFHESEVEVTGDEIAVITTPKGVIKFEFYPEAAPNHVASFIELADAGFYDGIKFHRVEPGFVVQGGDPLSREDDAMTGTGGPGYYLKSEFGELPHVDGTVSMARAQDPDSAGSQFFICMGEQPFLDGQYTVFGQVVEGLDVVYEIAVGDPMESVAIQRPE